MQAVSINPPAENVFVDKIVFNHFMFQTIFDNLTPLEFLRLARTCRVARAVVQRFIEQTFTTKINQILSRFFTDPVAFRSLQACTGTLISGSVALQFFDRTFYPGSDLDLYIPPQSDRHVLQWFPQNGYRFAPTSAQPKDLEEAIDQGRVHGFPNDIFHEEEEDYWSMGTKYIKGVYTFIKPSLVENAPDLQVQCIVTENAPLDVVLSFHSTCVMNVISYEKAYCLYPRATLHDHHTVINDLPPSSSQPAALSKYKERGFTICNDIRCDEAVVDISFRLWNRSIGDSLCWSIPLDMEGVGPGYLLPGKHQPLSHDPVSISQWRLIPSTTHLRFYKETYTHPFLYFTYVISREAVMNDPRAACDRWWDYEPGYGDEHFINLYGKH
ncbi:hypothetical protein BXZ70DRAFT_1010836 [Cristinia sonorae]|uniref:F-box domain-containing protein n=1 Tax=Cristinia sonorae TaxID=1940300 RepID=A0A8K0XML2_9AGAR|nr:hypothetical protein BXZ70DRAFT_1010836 [Cristinia sonorae]